MTIDTFTLCHGPQEGKIKEKDTHPLPGHVCLELGLWVSSLVPLTICYVTLDQWRGLSAFSPHL